MGHAGGHEHGGHEHGHEHELAELLDLDAEVLPGYLAEVTAWVRAQAAGPPVRRVLDLGAGTGTGTVALARRFPDAEVMAVDQSGEMVARIRARAAAAGLAGRVTAVQADLAAAWPATGPADVAWASNVLHELADPGAVLARALAAIRPGGLLAVAEMDGPPRFLPDDPDGLGNPDDPDGLGNPDDPDDPDELGDLDDLGGPGRPGPGRPGLEARCQAALAPAGPSRPAADWDPHLERAGFELAARRAFVIDLAPPLPPAAGRYARAYLRRIRPHLEGRLDAADRAALDALISGDGPGSLLRRTDLRVRGARTAWIGRRP